MIFFVNQQIFASPGFSNEHRDDGLGTELTLRWRGRRLTEQESNSQLAEHSPAANDFADRTAPSNAAATAAASANFIDRDDRNGRTGRHRRPH